MELTTTIKKLEEIKKELDKSSSLLIEEEAKKLDLIIYDLKLDLLNTSTTGTLNKARNKKISAWHKKQLKSCRPVLAYCNYVNDYQIITDGNFLVALADPDKTELISDYKETKRTYPETTAILNNTIKSFLNDNITLDIEKLTAIFKLHEYIYIMKDNSLYTAINRDNFNNLITFLNISSNADITNITIYNNYFLNIQTASGSYGTLCLIKTNENHKRFINEENTVNI